MNPSPYNQFDLNAQPPLATPVAPAKKGPRRILLPAVAIAVVAVVAFGGGYVVANATATQGGSNARTGGAQGFGPNASGRPRNGFGGNNSGTVGSVSADQMTITTAAGGSKIILLTPTTTVTKISSTPQALTDIASGTQVTVAGTTNPDGSVTATSVIIGNLGGFGRGGDNGGGNGGGGANGAPAPSRAP
jgi:hypothetical protein